MQRLNEIPCVQELEDHLSSQKLAAENLEEQLRYARAQHKTLEKSESLLTLAASERDFEKRQLEMKIHDQERQLSDSWDQVCA